MLFHLHDDPVQRRPDCMITCSIANQADDDLGDLGRHRLARPPPLSSPAALLGLIPGIWVLLHVDRHLYMHVLGAFLAINGAYRLLGKPVVLSRKSPLLETIIGSPGRHRGGELLPRAPPRARAAMQA